jgi:undecaprenyl pyrophosphate phosphatase UppP
LVIDRGECCREFYPAFTSWPLILQIGALIAHVILFWRKDVWASIKAFRTGVSEDRHHAAMLVKYKEVPTWWYLIILTVAFVFGIIVTTTQNITMPVWSYIIALLTGAFVAPFVSPKFRISRTVQNLLSNQKLNDINDIS